MVKNVWVVGLLVVTLLFSAMPAPALAQQPAPQQATATNPLQPYEELFAEYGIVPTKDVPEGVVPFRVETPEDMAALMEMLTAPATDAPESPGPEAYVSRYCVATNWATGQMRVYGNFEVVGRRVTRHYGVVSSLSGVTLGFSLTSPWGYFTSPLQATYASWVGGGTLNAHILVQGLPVLWSQRYSCSGRYNVP